MLHDEGIRGVGLDPADDHLKELGPLLTSFIETVEDYCRSEGSPPYWFNERASVSLLSGAAWRAGWIAIEEFPTRKVMLERSTETDLTHRYGRCDFYAKDPGGLSFAFEAKHVMAKPSQLANEVTAALRLARDDAAQLLLGEATARVALVFAVPHFPIGDVKSPSDIHSMINTLLHGVTSDESSGASPAIADGLLGKKRRATHAYVFPAEMRGCLGPAEKAYWPGVIVIAQRVKKAKSSVLRPAAPGEGLVEH